VVAQPYSERPPRFVYELTAGGRELAGALRLLADWGARHGDDAEPLRHNDCGTPLEGALVLPHVRGARGRGRRGRRAARLMAAVEAPDRRTLRLTLVACILGSGIVPSWTAPS